MDTCFNAGLLDAQNGLRATPRGAEIDIRLPWYRSLPVSVVEVGSLSVDGKDVATSDIRFEVNGKSFDLNELPSHPGEFWFVLDSAVLRLPDGRPVWAYRCPPAVAHSANPPARRARPE